MSSKRLSNRRQSQWVLYVNAELAVMGIDAVVQADSIHIRITVSSVDVRDTIKAWLNALTTRPDIYVEFNHADCGWWVSARPAS